MIPLPSLSEDLGPVAEALDAASPDARINWMRGLGKRELKALYELADGQSLPLNHFCDDSGTITQHGAK